MTRPPRWPLVAVAALAFVTRGWAYLDPRQLVAARELDDATMYSVAVQLVHGHLPYRDVLYLHPPGMPLAMTPLAWLARWTGDAWALAVGRAGTVLLGVVCTVLVGLLLRRRGTAAVLVGAGLYAVWTPVVRTERVALLEPVLTVCLLLALLVLQRTDGAAVVGRTASRLRPTTTAPLLAGALTGVALTFKLWAGVTAVVLGLVVLATRGLRATGWFAGGLAAVVAVVVGPFVALAGSAVWRDTVTAQASRPATVDAFAYRLRRFSLLDGFDATTWTDAVLRVVALAAGAALVVTVVVGVVRWSRGRTDERRVETTTWALLALAQALTVLVAPSFFYHYAAFPAPALALLAGAAGAAAWSWARGLRRRAGERGDDVRWVGAASAVGVAVLAVCAVSACVPTKPAQPSNARVAAWAGEHRCVWGLASAVVRADAATPNAERGCDVPPDVYGEGVLAASRSGAHVTGTVLDDNPAWTAEMLRQLDSSDAAFLPLPEDGRWLRGESQRVFEEQFVHVATAGPFELWERRAVSR
ncbi:hypothetical protein ACFT5B_10080 [Luteimicrobium sp. NPDC057192]|uniref:hypothetical protein n=1 Tax=Luteimicrobium sp. NPDC057192 TaxID=3346042 RepID=UPI0036403C93